MNLPTGTSYMGGGTRTLTAIERDLIRCDVERVRLAVEEMHIVANSIEDSAGRMETDPHDLNLTVRTIRAHAQELSESADRLSNTTEVMV